MTKMKMIGAPIGDHFRLPYKSTRAPAGFPGPTLTKPIGRPARLAFMGRMGVRDLADAAAESQDVNLWEAIGGSTQTHICRARDAIAAFLYAHGLTLKMIGWALDREPTTVRDSLIRMGVERRKRGGRGPVLERHRRARENSFRGQVDLSCQDPPTTSRTYGDTPELLPNKYPGSTQDKCPTRLRIHSEWPNETRRPGLATRRLFTPEETEMTETVTAAGDGCKANYCAGGA